jgi:hypothetical protein
LGTCIVKFIEWLAAVNEFMNDPDTDHAVDGVMFKVEVLPLTDYATSSKVVVDQKRTYQKLGSINIKCGTCRAHLYVVK